ncbi:MAG: LysM peptidoglycan-binding domain-containing protein [Clostridiales bacterium]|nr:LysM peptidoglycan-binding domain-containing protein [Clostridiales bacterium]
MEIEILENKDFFYKVKKQDTLNSVSNMFKISEGQIIKDNNLNSKLLEEGDVLYIKEENNFLYSVKPLDTLHSLSIKFGVSKEYIIKKNELTSNNLFIGQIIVL